MFFSVFYTCLDIFGAFFSTFSLSLAVFRLQIIEDLRPSLLVLWSSGYYPALLYTSLALAIFLFRTLHLRVEPEVCIFLCRVSDPDPDWIRIQSGQWIQILIRNPDPDPGGQK
jgi:hypothetical protein